MADTARPDAENEQLGPARACARYTWDRVVLDTLNVYEQVLTARLEPVAPRTSDERSPAPR